MGAFLGLTQDDRHLGNSKGIDQWGWLQGHHPPSWLSGLNIWKLFVIKSGSDQEQGRPNCTSRSPPGLGGWGQKAKVVSGAASLGPEEVGDE